MKISYGSKQDIFIILAKYFLIIIGTGRLPTSWTEV